MRNISILTRFLIIMILVVTATSSIAQPPRGRGGGHSGQMGQMDQGQPKALPDSTQIVQMVDELAEQVSLDEKQVEKVNDLFFAHFAEAEKQMSNASGQRQNQHQQMQSLRSEFENEVKSVLREDQIEAFEEYLANHRPPQGQQQGQRQNRRR